MSAALIDTHALLWLIDNSPRLSKPALARISEPGIELFDQKKFRTPRHHPQPSWFNPF